MDENADILYVDTRNADVRHGNVIVSGSPQGGTRVQTATPGRTMYLSGQNQLRPVGSTSQPMVIYAQPPTGFGSWFGKLTTGQVIDMVAQLFAMLQPLPAAPVATAVAATDIGNSILYQQALAEYAKRDEQVRTIGSLVAKLVG
jgi:hypothetical protein